MGGKWSSKAHKMTLKFGKFEVSAVQWSINWEHLSIYHAISVTGNANNEYPILSTISISDYHAQIINRLFKRWNISKLETRLGYYDVTAK